MPINTIHASAKYRERVVDVPGRRVLISRIADSDQEKDLREPPNASGLGRIRHFARECEGWVLNPLPIDPARAKLGLPPGDNINSQVFQLGACNWRCWYCFVPFELLAASPSRSEWIGPDKLVAHFARLSMRPPVLDLSGGEPDLAPEWLLWTMEALEAADLAKSTYLWSDDNLSTDYFWRYLTEAERKRIASYSNFGKVCCFKGFDHDSFAFNTGADPAGFDTQMMLFERYLCEGLDVYAYVTLTHPYARPVWGDIARFVDRLQSVDRTLPLRTVPLKLAPFTPVRSRLTALRSYALDRGQFDALDAWRTELERRFSAAERALPIQEVRWTAH